MKAFIESNFKILDINSDGIVGIEEYRYNCITRMAIDEVAPIDKAFETLLNVSKQKMRAGQRELIRPTNEMGNHFQCIFPKQKQPTGFLSFLYILY